MGELSHSMTSTSKFEMKIPARQQLYFLTYSYRIGSHLLVRISS